MIMNATAQESSRFFPTKSDIFGQLFENRKRNPMPPKGPTMTLVAGAYFFWGGDVTFSPDNYDIRLFREFQ